MPDRKAIAAELRVQLHRCADLIADFIESQGDAPPARRRVANGTLKVDDVSRQFAKNELRKLGWPTGRGEGR